MAVRTKKELMAVINDRFKDDLSDETLTFIADVSDTLDEGSKSVEWKQKYEQNDAEWRQKYRDRFFEGGTDKNEDDEDFNDDPPRPKTFDELFSVKE